MNLTKNAILTSMFLAAVSTQSQAVQTLSDQLKPAKCQQQNYQSNTQHFQLTQCDSGVTSLIIKAHGNKQKIALTVLAAKDCQQLQLATNDWGQIELQGKGCQYYDGSVSDTTTTLAIEALLNTSSTINSIVNYNAELMVEIEFDDNSGLANAGLGGELDDTTPPTLVSDGSEPKPKPSNGPVVADAGLGGELDDTTPPTLVSNDTVTP